MKLLLTSGGVSNASIKNALISLLGKPIAECNALCIPTASHPMRTGTYHVWSFISGHDDHLAPLMGLGWKSLGVLELTALPTIEKQNWVNAVQATDVLLVNGGDPLYLNYWMKQSGLADLLPSLHDKVWVGISAGSMIMAPDIGKDFYNWMPPTDDTKTLGIVDFAMFPHLDNPQLPKNIMSTAEKWAAGISGPAYVTDDQTAIKVVDGVVEVISEGHWKQLKS